MKDLECPNCGGANPEKLSEGEFRCTFCDTKFYNESMLQQKRKAEKEAAYAKNQALKEQAKIEQARSAGNMGKRVLIFVAVVLIIIFGFIGYMAKKSMDESAKTQEELIKSFQQEGK